MLTDPARATDQVLLRQGEVRGLPNSVLASRAAAAPLRDSASGGDTAGPSLGPPRATSNDQQRPATLARPRVSWGMDPGDQGRRTGTPDPGQEGIAFVLPVVLIQRRTSRDCRVGVRVVWGSTGSSSPPKSLVWLLDRGNSRGVASRCPLPTAPGPPREQGTGDQATDDAWGVVSICGGEQAADGTDDEEQGKEGPDHDLHVGEQYPAYARPWGQGSNTPPRGWERLRLGLC